MQEHEESKSPTTQSSLSTENESNKGSLVKIGQAQPIDIQVDNLQRRLTKSEDQRLEERFLWFAFSGSLFLVLTFLAAGVAAGGVMTTLFVAMLLVLSRRWGFEDLWEALHAARSLFSSKED